MLKEDIITGNAFRDICDDYIDEDKPYIDLKRKPKTIFLKTDWIEIFKTKVLPYIDYQFKLITHNADRPAISGNHDLLEDTRLIKWYGMNIDTLHPKLQSIPIGIANEKWSHGDKGILLDVISEGNTKRNFVYCNFDVSTNPDKRSSILKSLKQHSYIDFEISKLSFTEYLKKLSTYKFVISPPGNSVDCHRIWESIYLGVIPIVEKHLVHNYWSDLPILFVDSFNDINEHMLNTFTAEKLSSQKAVFSHYLNLIKQ